ncbi:hypothetical protein [Neobacillus terrae]|uniref:hypothetical protein n=1 Tax=Neobacillus terrae TaxID=3034837 RepID=UPI00140D6982|nr:hypothetical protein [Neobacillus terrae]NHM30492.1 hypothetical protein [Neobacillus terrae]
MKRNFKIYSKPPWVRKIRAVCAQFIIPFCIFQGIRAILIPTFFDVLLLIVFIAIAFAIQLEYF